MWPIYRRNLSKHPYSHRFSHSDGQNVLHCLIRPVSQAISELRQNLPASWGWIQTTAANSSMTLYTVIVLPELITFTRSRPYQKNDQAHVEQKNWSVVRHTVGYDRLETPEELACSVRSILILGCISTSFSLCLSSFLNITDVGKIIRAYDQAKTPFRRVLALDSLPFEIKARLTDQYLYESSCFDITCIDSKVALLWKIVR